MFLTVVFRISPAKFGTEPPRLPALKQDNRVPTGQPDRKRSRTPLFFRKVKSPPEFCQRAHVHPNRLRKKISMPCLYALPEGLRIRVCLRDQKFNLPQFDARCKVQRDRRPSETRCRFGFPGKWNFERPQRSTCFFVNKGGIQQDYLLSTGCAIVPSVMDFTFFPCGTRSFLFSFGIGG